jgi:hypothetical protein
MGPSNLVTLGGSNSCVRQDIIIDPHWPDERLLWGYFIHRLSSSRQLRDPYIWSGVVSGGPLTTKIPQR